MSVGPKGWFLLQWIIAFTVICAVVLVLRVWAARMTKRKLFLDDAFVVIAFLFTLACEGTLIWTILNGLGNDSLTTPPDELVVQAKAFALPTAMTWLIASVFLKLSMLSLYTRIFSTRVLKNWSYALMVVVVCYGISFIVVFLTNCFPIDNLWNPQPGGWCHNPIYEEFASIGLNMVIDLAIVILPMPALWGLNMPFRNKFFVSIMFGIGLITIGIMCWRLEITAEAARTTDFFFLLPHIGLVSQLELWLGLIVVCMPTLAPLMKAYVKPAITWVKSAPSSYRRGEDSVKLKDVSGERPPPRSYYNIETGLDDADEFIMHDHHNKVIKTECAYDPTGDAVDGIPERDRIHVRKDIESHGTQ